MLSLMCMYAKCSDFSLPIFIHIVLYCEVYFTFRIHTYIYYSFQSFAISY